MSSALPQRVGAVVVTFNRKDLLRESLAALRAQTRPLDLILVIDNASTDGTPDLVRDEFPDVELLRLEVNGGGAGGFHEGLRSLHVRGYEWIWVMDDDTIPRPDALQALLAAHQRFEPEHRPILLASHVVWTDGRPHPHNYPHSRRVHPDVLMTAARHSTLAVRSASFVSLLIHRDAITRHGLPHPDFFIWFDDVEFTGRILRHQTGVYVPASVVCHKTRGIAPYAQASAGPRFFYFIRNIFWMLRMHRTWSRAERIDLLKHLAVYVPRFLAHERYRPRAAWIILRGLALGLLTRPRPELALPPQPGIQPPLNAAASAAAQSNSHAQVQ